MIQLSATEIENLKQLDTQFAMIIIQNSLGNASLDNPFALTQFLSTSAGQQRLDDVKRQSRPRIDSLTPSTEISLELTFDLNAGTIRGSDEIAQAIVTILDRRLPIQETLFSIFPADRQLPQGEQNLQLGSADSQNQLASYMGNPSLKYARLKQVIMQHIVLGDQGRQAIEREFNTIFDNLLPGKQLLGIHINQFGLVKVLVRETETNKVFDIDQMSSGEKGLVLTFLFLRLSLAQGGIVFLDEPELHLNSSVQAMIMPFIKDCCIKQQGLQVFICTHSPEIVKCAFEDEECNLYHLRSGTDLTPIYIQDHRELFDVFERLGSSPAEVLFTKGNIYVEGLDDHIILQAGYAEAIFGYKISPLGGRGEIEKEVPILQREERAGRLKKKQLFILDNDRKASNLQSSPLVRVYQHERYCLENYLIDEEIMYEIIRTAASRQPDSRNLFSKRLEELSLSQINEIVIFDLYERMRPISLDMKMSDVKGRSFQEVAELLAQRFDDVKGFLTSYSKAAWTSNFTFEAERQKNELLDKWRPSWKKLASGKRLIDDLYVEYEIRLRKPDFKKQIMEEMAKRKTDDWRVLDQIIKTELS